jgi:hypothetical protein
LLDARDAVVRVQLARFYHPRGVKCRKSAENRQGASSAAICRSRSNGNSLMGLVHGLASLHLDGKFDTSSADAVAQKVRTSVRVMLAASDQSRLHRASKARQ